MQIFEAMNKQRNGRKESNNRVVNRMQASLYNSGKYNERDLVDAKLSATSSAKRSWNAMSRRCELGNVFFHSSS